MEDVNVQNQDGQAQGTAAQEDKSAIPNDIEKIEAHIEALKTGGAELYADAIAALESKRDELIAEAKAGMEEVVEELKVVEKNFVQKYGQATAHGVEIILLGIIVAKLLGAV